ncbi:MAG: hypothetical protein UZ17_ACD001001172 [Acidobacteria bacterium OLB17]|nr:MAG: hypothetical protein UZ17_ACD001001172 [Acidobacteria bacterium OLB17]MCZ2391881.1 hypothetical protein [Acidobacteriota bacterium]
MNIFEDLVLELKEENLLENTFLDELEARSREVEGSDAAPASNARAGLNDEAVPEYSDIIDTPGEAREAERHEIVHQTAERIEADAPEVADLQLMGSDETIEIRRPASDTEFFKKRANGEVLSLQLVEHVVSALEREHLKIIPKTYDDLSVKKALHRFMQVADDSASDAHKEAEFQLMQEIEAWCSALAKRDAEISIAALRRYCENCRPKLSSQAMLALARFYRNLPYNEDVRGKFDYIVTRLFSRPVSDNTRKLLFTGSEMFGHIKALYADWSSIPLYSADDEENIGLSAASFRELQQEAEDAAEFDDLIRSDFFGRIQLFKENIAELFFAPTVITAAIECNVSVGNAYVKLLDKERLASGAAVTHEKYGSIDNEAVSEAAARTLELDSTLRSLIDPAAAREEDDEPSEHAPEHAEPVETIDLSTPKPERSPAAIRKRKSLLETIRERCFGINPFLLIGSVGLILISVGIYAWAGWYVEEDTALSKNVVMVKLDPIPFKENLKLAKKSGDTFYGVVLPGWETMTNEKREEFLRAVTDYGKTGGWVNVNLLNGQGKTVGYASPGHFEIIDKPQ